MKAAAGRAALILVLLALSACAHKSTGFKKASPADMAQANMQLSIEYMKLGKLMESRNFIEKALSQDPQNPDVQMTAKKPPDHLQVDQRPAFHRAGNVR